MGTQVFLRYHRWYYSYLRLAQKVLARHHGASAVHFPHRGGCLAHRVAGGRRGHTSRHVFQRRLYRRHHGCSDGHLSKEKSNFWKLRATFTRMDDCRSSCYCWRCHSCYSITVLYTIFMFFCIWSIWSRSRSFFNVYTNSSWVGRRYSWGLKDQPYV